MAPVQQIVPTEIADALADARAALRDATLSDVDCLLGQLRAVLAALAPTAAEADPNKPNPDDETTAATANLPRDCELFGGAVGTPLNLSTALVSATDNEGSDDGNAAATSAVPKTSQSPGTPRVSRIPSCFGIDAETLIRCCEAKRAALAPRVRLPDPEALADGNIKTRVSLMLSADGGLDPDCLESDPDILLSQVSAGALGTGSRVWSAAASLRPALRCPAAAAAAAAAVVAANGGRALSTPLSELCDALGLDKATVKLATFVSHRTRPVLAASKRLLVDKQQTNEQAPEDHSRSAAQVQQYLDKWVAALASSLRSSEDSTYGSVLSAFAQLQGKRGALDATASRQPCHAAAHAVAAAVYVRTDALGGGTGDALSRFEGALLVADAIVHGYDAHSLDIPLESAVAALEAGLRLAWHALRECSVDDFRAVLLPDASQFPSARATELFSRSSGDAVVSKLAFEGILDGVPGLACVAEAAANAEVISTCATAAGNAIVASSLGDGVVVPDAQSEVARASRAAAAYRPCIFLARSANCAWEDLWSRAMSQPQQARFWAGIARELLLSFGAGSICGAAAHDRLLAECLGALGHRVTGHLQRHAADQSKPDAQLPAAIADCTRGLLGHLSAFHSAVVETPVKGAALVAALVMPLLVTPEHEASRAAPDTQAQCDRIQVALAVLGAMEDHAISRDGLSQLLGCERVVRMIGHLAHLSSRRFTVCQPKPVSPGVAAAPAATALAMSTRVTDGGQRGGVEWPLSGAARQVLSRALSYIDTLTQSLRRMQYVAPCDDMVRAATCVTACFSDAHTLTTQLLLIPVIDWLLKRSAELPIDMLQSSACSSTLFQLARMRSSALEQLDVCAIAVAGHDTVAAAISQALTLVSVPWALDRSMSACAAAAAAAAQDASEARATMHTIATLAVLLPSLLVTEARLLLTALSALHTHLMPNARSPACRALASNAAAANAWLRLFPLHLCAAAVRALATRAPCVSSVLSSHKDASGVGSAASMTQRWVLDGSPTAGHAVLSAALRTFADVCVHATDCCVPLRSGARSAADDDTATALLVVHGAAALLCDVVRSLDDARSARLDVALARAVVLRIVQQVRVAVEACSVLRGAPEVQREGSAHGCANMALLTLCLQESLHDQLQALPQSIASGVLDNAALEWLTAEATVQATPE